MSTPSISSGSANEDKGIFDKLTLGAVKSLEKRQGVCDVILKQQPGVSKSTLQLWEQSNTCILPDDIKDFFLTNNGFVLKWNVRINESLIPVGKMQVNSIEKLQLLGGSSKATGTAPPTAVDVQSDDEEDDEDLNTPKFDQRSRIFELDPCDGYGKTCLVYNNTKPGIPASRCEMWFMDRSLCWHFLADSFLSYYRLLLLHLGLPQWQYNFTPLGLSPQAKQWFNIYAPARLEVTNDMPVQPDSETSAIKNKLDTSKIFKGKSDKRKVTQQTQNIKKKPTAPIVKGPNTLLKASGTTSLVRPSIK